MRKITSNNADASMFPGENCTLAGRTKSMPIIKAMTKMSCDIDEVDKSSKVLLERNWMHMSFSALSLRLYLLSKSPQNNFDNPFLKKLGMSFWAKAELPHLLVAELIQVCMHLHSVHVVILALKLPLQYKSAEEAAF